MEDLGNLSSTLKIPKVMSFFWAGDNLSWMRYMTIKSFRSLHPDWKINLHKCNRYGIGRWLSNEMQDSHYYDGQSYLDQVKMLDVNISEWNPPIPDMAPSHACDICEWEILSTTGGFFSDMDVLWVRKIPYGLLAKNSSVFVLTCGFAAIGLCACEKNSKLFSELKECALENYRPSKYQSTGAEAIYRLAGIWPKWGAQPLPGYQSVKAFSDRFDGVTYIPETVIYPWDYTKTEMIFEQDLTVPLNCFGIHWFGGSLLGAKYNGLLTHRNYREYKNTFCTYARKVA